MSETTPNKAGVYLPTCYIVVRSGYEAANALCPFPAPNGEPSPDSSLFTSDDDIKALEQPATVEHQNALEHGLQDLQGTLAGISSQLASLIECQCQSQHRLSRVEELCIENATQIESLTANQATIQQQLQQVTKDQDTELQSMREIQAENTKQLQQTVVTSAEAVMQLIKKTHDWQVLQFQTRSDKEKTLKAERAVACTHNVHPPPRKIDRPIVGYDYGTCDGGSGKWRVDKAPGLLRY